MDKSAVQQIQETAHIPETLEHLGKVKTHIPTAFVPRGYELVDIEGKQEFLSRYRMQFATNSINDFIQYSKDFAQPGAACFVDASGMNAEIIFDLGTVEKPLHKSHKAGLSLEKTATFKAMLEAEGKQNQKGAGDFIEDWADNIEIIDASGEGMTPTAASNAIRNLTIESARSLTSTVDDYSESMSAMERIEAQHKERLPSLIRFTCVPYLHLKPREFSFRVSVLTGGDRPTLSLRLIKLEEMKEQIADEFKAVIVDGLFPTDAEVYMGSV